MTVALEYKRANANFIQQITIMQNGSPFDLTKVSGALSITWWWLENKSGAVKKSINYFSYSGANNNIVSFVIPSGFLSVATDYNCDIEIYNDAQLILHTDPSFIVSVKDVAGVHTDP